MNNLIALQQSKGISKIHYCVFFMSYFPTKRCVFFNSCDFISLTFLLIDDFLIFFPSSLAAADNIGGCDS